MELKIEEFAIDGAYDGHDLVMSEYYDDCPPNDLTAPEPGSEEETLVAVMRRAMTGRRVLEVACGAGWASRHVVQVAESVVATDVSRKRLDLARRAARGIENLQIETADAYRLDGVGGTFDAAMAIAWFAHVPRLRHREFLDGLHRRVGRGGRVFLADEMYHLGLTRRGEQDDYEVRFLADGKTYEIVDNKFDRRDLVEIFGPGSRDLNIHVGRDYWWVHYAID